MNMALFKILCISIVLKLVVSSESDKTTDDEEALAGSGSSQMYHQNQWSGVKNGEQNVCDGDSCDDKFKKDIPVIIWWTDRLVHWRGHRETKCGCYVTTDKKLKGDPRTRGFIFYGTDLEPTDLPLPRAKAHEWALFHEESPMNNYMLSHGAMIRLFNHTATFKRESDFPLTTQDIPSLDHLTAREPFSTEQKNKYRLNGLAPIVYVQSHCDIASDRDRYVQELMKYIPIDSYGACVNNKEMPKSLSDPVESMATEEFLAFIARYKFQLSMENAICNDYMTEKLFRPLHVGSVPIYRGSPKVKDWMPNEKSIILIDDFATPKDLAEFIMQLDKDDTEYDNFLAFKSGVVTNQQLLNTLNQREWGVNDPDKPDFIDSFECYVCKKLIQRHENEKQMRNGEDVAPLPNHHAETAHLSCPQPYTSYGDITDISRDDKWLRQHWIEDYWYGLDKARAIQKMLMNKDNNSNKFYTYLSNK